MWSIGTDTGGTFTDLVAFSDAGEIRVAKSPSTPPHFEGGVVGALEESGLDPADVRVLYHGTTVSTNALLTRTGARTGLVSTRGFRDVIEIRDGSRGEFYDVLWDPPEPLVPRHDRLEVTERVDYAGAVVAPLDEADVRDAARLLRARGVEAVAVALIHSYANAAHEERIRGILAEELPGVYVASSADVLPEPPEFPRTSTTVANAYVGPVLRRYVERLESALGELGYRGTVVIMHSGGGTMTPENAIRVPIRTATSGPAAGVLAAAAIATAAGRANVVSLDMGGTSADIATIRDGRPRTSVSQLVEWGMPIGFPSIDLVVIGAGGGSIAWIDEAGVPHSGPQSAGADPGPACYGRSGVEPTNTDANVVLGRLRPKALLGGRMALDVELARAAVRDRFAAPLGLDLHEAADGILRISNQNMANGVRAVTVQHGLDPREFSLLAFGGAGPMHAVDIARELRIPEVIVPQSPGATSALGLLFADARHDFLRSSIRKQDEIDCPELEAQFAELEAQARQLLADEGFTPDAIVLQRLLDLRYVGQVRALSIPLDAGPFDSAGLEDAVARFHQDYEAEFKYAVPDLPVESKSLRVVATGVTAKPSFLAAAETGDADDALVGTFDAYFREAGGLVPTRFYDRARLAPGATFAGPAIVEQYDSTTVVPPGATVRVDPFRNLLIEVG
ncbi:MAG: hydantoinase/oxoprolinase family protein [Thermoleophilia bacterium]